MTADAKARLEQIREDILNDNVCPDLAKQATNLVMGDGSPTADIIFIGEAPGKNEDLRGVPFVGAAGKFLDEMLSSVGLQRSDIYITNIVKYRPPNNRDPLPQEKKAFWPYLVRQLEVINPMIIVTLGRHSMEYFLPDARITAVHGQPKHIRIVTAPSSSKTHLSASGNLAVGKRQSSPEEGPVTEEKSVVLLPLYHPAAALYNGGLRQTLLDDFQIIPILLQQTK